jgi:hypothetical protein
MDELTNQSEEVTQEIAQDQTQEVTQEQTQESTTAQQVEQLPQSIRVKYNAEEREIPIEEAIVLTQKGLNYEKAVERAKQEARDAYIADEGYQWKGKPITTEAAYKEALKEQELENKIRAQYTNVPDEIVSELTEGRKFREQYQTKEQQQKMYQEFADAYPDLKGDEIPPEVWKEVQNGKNLLDAYVRYENKTLRDQLNGVQAKDQAAQANQANALSSTGSVKTQGTPQGSLTEEMVENMSPQELASRWQEVKKLYKMK